MANYTTRSPTATQSVQPVQITSVDLIGMTAVAQTRNNTQVRVSLSYYVGGIHVVPVTGDQWLVRWYGNSWILDTQLAYNTTELATIAANPTQGMTQVGSTNPNAQGPTHINGSQINLGAPLGLPTYTNATLPAASAVPVGTIIYNIDLSETQSSNGTAWTTAGTGSAPTGGSVTGQSVFGEALAGSKNNSNVVFTTAQNFVTASTVVFRNGLREMLNVGYSEVQPNTIHFSTPPLSDDVILIDYLGPMTFTATQIYGETPTGSENSSNEVFTLAHNFQAGSTQVYINSLREQRGVNYVETAPNQLTFTTPPVPGDLITVDYLTSS